MLPFNLSYSAWDLYRKSQLQFYYEYVSKAATTDPGSDAYGAAGNVVHQALERFIRHGTTEFDALWEESGVNCLPGLNGAPLDREEYLAMFRTGAGVVAAHWDRGRRPVPELAIKKIFFGQVVKGFMDSVILEDCLIEDWKTNRDFSAETHRAQRLFYSWLFWKCTGKLSTCRWHYLREKDAVFKDRFGADDLAGFDRQIRAWVDTLLMKGQDITQYSPGDYKNPFNKHYSLCLAEHQRRQAPTPGERIEVLFRILGNYVQVDESAPPRLLEGIDHALKFDLPDKYHMQQAVRKKGGMFDLADIGTVHIYNPRLRCFPIGALRRVLKVVEDYSRYYKVELVPVLQDFRDQAVMTRKIEYRLKMSSKRLRPYQEQALKAFLDKNGFGILDMPTGSGKTFLAAHIIRAVAGKTLWIIDRRELVQQTRKELAGVLDCDIGEISGGTTHLTDITVATVQSLVSRLDELKEYLQGVNFVVIDEFHKAAAESYQRVLAKLPNTKYRLGLTGTVKRDDGKEPILYSLLGDIIYKVEAQELISQGYLVRPEIRFIDIKGSLPVETYTEDYHINVVTNDERNHHVYRIVTENLGKKILIMTKTIKHGRIFLHSIPGSQHLHGRLEKSVRERMYADFVSGLKPVLIITLAIGAEGLDVPDLDIVVNASANKGDVKSIQALGRVLRVFQGKDKAVYYDFLDKGRHTRKHSHARVKALHGEGYEVTIDGE